MSDLTAKKVADAIESIGTNQRTLNAVMTETFTGQNLKAAKASIGHLSLIELIDRREVFTAKHATANKKLADTAKAAGAKAKPVLYQGLNILQTEANRWLQRCSNHKRYVGLRASIKTTGTKAQWSFCLVKSTKGTSGSTAPGSTEVKDTPISELALKDAIGFLVHASSYSIVASALLKLK